MLFCSAAKVKPLVLNVKTSSGVHCFIKTLSTNFDCAFRKSYAVTA